MTSKAKSPDTRVRLAVDVVELLGDWMTRNGHTSPTVATNAALRQFLKGYTSTPTQAVVSPAKPHRQPQSTEPESLLHSAFSDLLSE